MPIKRLKFMKEKCIGCQLCAQACSAKHEGEYIPSKARIGIEVQYENNGRKINYKEDYCILCGICERKCPNEAISIVDKILVDNILCTGCGVCAENCPKNVIKIRGSKAIICDTCDGNPECVRICPHGALKYE